MEPIERERKIRAWSQRLHQEIAQVLPARPVEADFQRVVDPLLDGFCAEMGVNPLAHAEYTLATGRADAVFNRFVIEYERPGVLKRTRDAVTQHPVDQVKRYIEDLAKKERHAVERLAGVAFDGHTLIFVRWVRGRWEEESPVEANRPALERIEAEIDEQAAKLWGLSEAELRQIRQSLRELAGEEEPADDL